MKKKIDFYGRHSQEDVDRLISYNKEHEREFKQLVERKDLNVFDKIKDVMPDCALDIKVGQICTYTNIYGVYFTGQKILGFCKPEDNYGCSVYLDTDCYWSPKPINSISI